MLPYHLLDPNIPLPQAFEYVHLNWAKYVVSTGAIISLSTWYLKKKINKQSPNISDCYFTCLKFNLILDTKVYMPRCFLCHE